jgi:hypothetical protein
MRYTPEQLLAMPDAERDAIAAEVCMGWFKSEYGTAWVQEGAFMCSQEGWQPSQPTEKGKAQAWDLMLSHSTIGAGGVRYGCLGLDGDIPQKAAVTAAILAAQAEQEK